MKYILITGGGLSNKGAAAMVFATVDEVKRRFPGYKVVVLSNDDFKNITDIRNKYNFEIKPDIIRYKFVYGLYSRLKKISRAEVRQATTILKNTKKVIDISGYAIGSNWSLISQLFYLSRIKVLKRYNIPIYLMPQSFGPFNYKGLARIFIKWQIKRCFGYCKVIFAREKEGFYELVNKFRLKNVKRSPDLVLLNKEVDYKNIFVKMPRLNTVDIQKNSVAIIPNTNTLKHISQKEIINLYELGIRELLKKQVSIYIMRHSSEDIHLCKNIKDRFSDNEEVILLSNDFTSIEFNHIVKEMNFIIASRYHSIIHAYKNHVPCIALGWATKYHELLKMFEQDRYIFDVRKEIQSSQFLSIIDCMLEEYSAESNKIKSILNNIQQEDIFDILGVEQIKLTVKESTVENGLCISCGICAAVCPQKCIRFIERNGQYLPSIHVNNCINCGVCCETCSAHKMNFSKYATINGQGVAKNWMVGDYIKCYNGSTNNHQVHINSTSGGLVTTIVQKMLDDEIYNKAFLVDEFKYSGIVETKLYSKGCNLDNTQKSRYIPVSHKEAVTFMLNNRSQRVIIVATSCVIHTLLNVIDQYKLNRDHYLLLGLFCDRTLNQNIYKYFSDMIIDDGELKNLLFRTKEKNGWPGDIKLELTNGKDIILSKTERMKVKDYFQLERCLYCVDKLNQFADISLGDNYTKKQDNINGSNSLIIRTIRGERVIEQLASEIEIYEVDIQDIEKSQAMHNRKTNFIYANLLYKYRGINLYPQFMDQNEKVGRRKRDMHLLRKRKKRILLGKNYPGSKTTLKRILALEDIKVILKSKVKRIIRR